MRSSLARARSRSLARPVALGTLVLLAACQTLLGIEDLSTTPRQDGAEPVGSAGGSGSGSTLPPVAGPTSDLPAGLDAPASGSAGAGVDSAPPADAGAPLADASDGGGGTSATLVVRGRVVDFYQRPVPDVPVSIGEQRVVSDADGRFSIAGVSAPYDVSLLLDFLRDGVPARYGYVYQDLTRADPTLQVYSALPQRAVSSLDVTFDVSDFDADPQRGLIFGFASADTDFADGLLSNGTTSILGGLSWAGPVSTAGNAHALLVSRPDGVEGAPPFAYQQHLATPLVATDETVAAVAFTMQPGGIAAAAIAGNVSGDTLGDRTNLVALRFADGTALPLIEESTPGESFSYLVPELPDSSLVVAASQGFIAPFAIAWQDGIAAGQTGLAFALPSPVRLGAPQPDATIQPDTPFSWSRPSGAAHTFLWHVELENDSVYQGVFVATARTEIQLPSFPDGFTLPAGSSAVWSVETHGDLPDVDAMTGPDGFLDSFSIPPQTYPLGRRQGGGSYTESSRSFFTMGGG